MFASSEPVPGFQGDTLQLAFIDLRQVSLWDYFLLMSDAEARGTTPVNDVDCLLIYSIFKSSNLFF